jgi:hypothetical protein
MILTSGYSSHVDGVKGYPLGHDSTDAVQILKYMEGFVEQYQAMPFIREEAVRIIHGTDNNDQLMQVNLLANYVREKMVYVRDPNNSEFIVAPDILLHKIHERGMAYGDCDDHVVLLNTLMGSLGITTRIAGVKLPDSNVWNHVISQAFIGGNYYQIDSCSKKGTIVAYSEQLFADGN